MIWWRLKFRKDRTLRRFRPGGWWCTGLLFLLLLAQPARAEVTADVEARAEKGFGRLVFEFDRMPAYSKQVAASILVLQFREAIKVKVADIAGRLPRYVRIVRVDPDRQAIRFALVGAHKVNIMKAGTLLFVDLLPPGWKGDPPPLPQSVIKRLAEKAAAAEARARAQLQQLRSAKDPLRLTIKAAEQPTFSRLTFRWNRYVNTRMTRDGDGVILKFAGKATADLRRLNVSPPRYLRRAKAVQETDGLVVSLLVDPAANVRGFRNGNDYVVDLDGPETAAEAVVSQAVKTIKKAGLIPSKETRKSAGAAKKTETVSFAGNWQSEVAPGHPENKATAPTVRKTKARPKPEIKKSIVRVEAPGGIARAKTMSNAAAKPLGDNGKPADDADNLPKTGSREPAVRQNSEPNKGHTKRDGNALTMAFPFARPVAAAMFQRGQTLWLVFDSTEPIDTRALQNTDRRLVRRFSRQATRKGQVLKMKLAPSVRASVSAQGNIWTVRLGGTPSADALPLDLRRTAFRNRRPAVSIPLDDGGRVRWLADPDHGGTIGIVTAWPPVRGVANTHDFVDFRALTSLHGIAIAPRAGDLVLELDRETLFVTRPGGLTLSLSAPEATPRRSRTDQRRSTAGRSGKSNVVFDVRRLRAGGVKSFLKTAAALQREVARARKRQRNALRLRLAELYLAQGLSAEALGLMNQIVGEDSNAQNNGEFKLLRAIANIQLHRMKPARRDLAAVRLRDNPEAALWRGLVEEGTGNWQAALDEFDKGRGVESAYPPVDRERFHLSAARAALEAGRNERAAMELDTIREPAAARRTRAELALLRGWYNEKLGRPDEALEQYEAAVRTGYRPVEAAAHLRQIALRLRDGSIQDERALAELEGLYFTWRGDETELKTLQLLSRLHVRKGRYREAFRAMKTALKSNSNSPLALELQDEMAGYFKRLFLQGEADRMAPVQALGLFYDYRELTPVGRLGDEMIRRLADRLTAVDLLDQAADLLDHQVNKRLKGVARAQVAVRLALVHLLNRKPNRALRIIRQTRMANLPRGLRKSRTLLEVRSLAELGSADAALELLSGLTGSEVERVKSDVLWSAKKWLGSGEQLEKMLGRSWQKKTPLDDAQRLDVLRAAISYALANDNFGLTRLRQKFQSKMADTADAAAFTAVTSPIEAEGTAFREITANIAAIDTLDRFLASFRKRYQPGADPIATGSVR